MISVALCTYNGEKYIRQQLDSILTQTMPVDEIVIHDDCSTDSTYEILTDYASRYPRIFVRKNSANIGFLKNFENTLAECQGDYIFLSDQDDIWVKDKVALTVDFLKETGKYGVFSNGQLIDENGNIINHTLFSIQKLSPYIESGLLDKYAFEILCLKGNFVTGAALAITKNAKDCILPFRTTKHIIHDMWIALNLSSKHKLGYIEQSLIMYRIHSQQECGLNLNKEYDRDPLIDCFTGRGDCNCLLKLRRSSAVLIYYCRLLREEKLLSKTFFNLYLRALNNSPNKFKNGVLYCINELYAKVVARFGFRV